MRAFTNAQARYFHERLVEAQRAGYKEGFNDGIARTRMASRTSMPAGIMPTRSAIRTTWISFS